MHQHQRGRVPHGPPRRVATARERVLQRRSAGTVPCARFGPAPEQQPGGLEVACRGCEHQGRPTGRVPLVRCHPAVEHHHHVGEATSVGAPGQLVQAGRCAIVGGRRGGGHR